MGRNRRLRVLITTSTFPSSEGDGKARFVLDLAMALAACAEVTVLAPRGVGATHQAPGLHSGPVRVRRFGYFWPRRYEMLTSGPGMRQNLRDSWLARLQAPVFLLIQALATLLVVARDRPDLINPHWLVPQGLTGVLAARMFRVPMVLHVHAADVYFLRRIPFGSAIARIVVRSSSRVFADGSHVRDALDELIGAKSGAILRPMGVWTDQFVPMAPEERSAPPYIAFVGRLVEKKGVEFLIRALPTVVERVADIRLIIAGSGPLGSSLEDLVTRLGLETRVDFVGPVSHAEVLRLLGGSAVVCVPSIIDSNGETEGMPTVVVEAMASGKRVVGSAVDGIPDVIQHSENGWLARPEDPEDLARRLIEALEEPSAPRVAENARRSAHGHDWAQVASTYMTVMNEVVDG